MARAAPPPPPLPAAAPSVPSELWIDKHVPKTSKEVRGLSCTPSKPAAHSTPAYTRLQLAMHPKKVDEVRSWLAKADISLALGLPPTPRLLVLSGPPGSGKSTLLRMLAAEKGFETIEWVEPRLQSWEPPGSTASAHADADPRLLAFANFLRESLRTLSLCVTPAHADGNSTASAPVTAGRRRLVILDDLATAPPHSSSGAARDLREQQIVRMRSALPLTATPVYQSRGC